MNNDRQITISSAGSRKATSWPQSTLYWSELVDKLKVPVKGKETLAVYLKMKKAQQDELKDVGGFVGGAVRGQRKAANILGRDIITLDLDNIPSGETDSILARLDAMGCAFAVYSTRKHEPIAPRLRVLVPLAGTVETDKYEPIARKLASLIGMEYCDPTTFQASRLMYWPSCSADSQYVFRFADKPFVSPDGILSMYGNWQNVAEWPLVPGEDAVTQRLIAKQGDPETKSGIVGAFCKTYNIYRAMEELIPGVYAPSDIPGRYTFTGGSTSGGAVIYDDGKFIYSHHATDPCSGKLCNAFDMVRLHLFEDKDETAKADTPSNKLPSFMAMCHLATTLDDVTTLLNTERFDKAVEGFSDLPAAPATDNSEWIRRLTVSPATGTPEKTTDNVVVILEHDPNLIGRIAFDEFSNRGLVLGAFPWDRRDERREWTDVDDAGLRHYIEKVYQITGKDRIYDALAIVAHKHRINDVKDYLEALPAWDSIRRLDTLLVDYLGAADSEYTRAVSRKSLVAAVARVMQPGIKYDYMPILAGPQGIGKSTFYRTLGVKWYSDSLVTFEGKEAAEMIQGRWINELGELNGLSKTETGAVKQFLSKTDDVYREAYGRRTQNYPRRCVFFGTTNDSEFLRDKTGNRRFWPVDVGIGAPSKDVFNQLEDELHQIWAEAFLYWRIGETLYLSGEAEKQAMEQQKSHQESNVKEGIIRDYLERPLPENWDQLTIPQRRMFWSMDIERPKGELFPRDRVCVLEVWCECFGGDAKYLRNSDAREINEILKSIEGWHPVSTGRFGPYGRARGFIRNSDAEWKKRIEYASTIKKSNVDKKTGNLEN